MKYVYVFVSVNLVFCLTDRDFYPSFELFLVHFSLFLNEIIVCKDVHFHEYSHWPVLVNLNWFLAFL